MIINADDFGRHATVNRAIVASFEKGLISSTTLMTNQPGFEEAVELVRALRLEQHVGVHLVLTDGTPLTDAIRRSRRFCDENGTFIRHTSGIRGMRVVMSDAEAVVRELSAQIVRARRAGLPVTHVDSHHHVHNEWGILGCVLAVAQDLDVAYVRLARNCGRGLGVGRRGYKRIVNHRLQRAGRVRTRWFGGVDDWFDLAVVGADQRSLDDFELMTHPALDAAGRLVDAVSGGNDLATLLAPVVGASSLVSYSGAGLS